MQNISEITKKGSVVVKVWIWNRTGTEVYDEASECKLFFSDGTDIMFECDEVIELENEHKGIYELLEDGTYIQIEDWAFAVN